MKTEKSPQMQAIDRMTVFDFRRLLCSGLTPTEVLDAAANAMDALNKIHGIGPGAPFVQATHAEIAGACFGAMALKSKLKRHQ